MNKAKKLKDITNITELDPSKVYLIGVGGKLDELLETAKKIYDAMLQFGVEKVLIIPENLIKSVMEISEEETEKVVKEIEKRKDQIVNREEQIKEIAEIIMSYCLKRLGEFSETETQVFFEGSKILDKAGYSNIILDFAAALYEAGYRKAEKN